MSQYQPGEFKHRLLLTFGVIALCAIVLLAVLRFSGDPEAKYPYSDYGEGILIEGYSGAPMSLTVPDTIDGKKVVAIGENAFLGQTKLRKIVLPDSVTEIGATAFADCTNLSKVVAKGVVSIGEEAFQGCGNLKTIELSLNIEKIDDRAFQWCSKLQAIAVSDALTEIGTDALAGCGNLVLTTGGNPVAEAVAVQYNLSTDGSDTGSGMWLRLGLATAGLAILVLIPVVILGKRKKNR